jgi:hypothetical protein
MNRNPDTYWNDEADRPTPEELESALSRRLLQPGMRL